MEDIKTIIEKIYKDYNPDKISNIPNLLEKYKGKEKEMLSKISDKYNIRLQDYIKIDYLWLVSEILKKYDPVNVSSASTLLSSNKNHEDELLTSLCNKYNAKLNDIIISIYISTAPALNQKAEILERKTFIPESQIKNKVQEPKKNNKILIYGIPAVVVIAVVMILFFTGIFSTNKKTNNDNTSNSSSVSNTDNSDSKTSNNEGNQSTDNSQPANTIQSGQQSNSGAFYIVNVAAFKSEKEAKTKSAALKNQGYQSGYLWIPDYASLSGAKLYSVYIGPYATQHDCEVATEEYRKVHPDAYGLLVSQDKKRVQINGIGKVMVTPK